MNILTLPKSLNVGGIDREINSDWRACFAILQLMERGDLLYHEKLQIIVGIVYVDDIEDEYMEESLNKAMWFLDGGDTPESSGTTHDALRVYSWDQDARYIIAAVDRVMGRSCRSTPYMHWWDFLSAFLEIGECTFSTLVHQRKQRQKGKQSQVDREWWAENKDIAELKVEANLSTEEQAALDHFNSLIG